MQMVPEQRSRQQQRQWVVVLACDENDGEDGEDDDGDDCQDVDAGQVDSQPATHPATRRPCTRKMRDRNPCAGKHASLHICMDMNPKHMHQHVHNMCVSLLVFSKHEHAHV